MARRETCRRCGAPIVWVRTAANGRPMPIDPDTTEDGNVALVRGRAHVVAGAQLEQLRAFDQPLYRPHFATCRQPRLDLVDSGPAPDNVIPLFGARR